MSANKETEGLKRLASQHQISMEPAVFAGFPEHTIDVKRPELFVGCAFHGGRFAAWRWNPK